MQRHLEDQFCVPGVATEGESFRLKQAARKEVLGSLELKITPKGGDFSWPKAGTENWPRTAAMGLIGRQLNCHLLVHVVWTILIMACPCGSKGVRIGRVAHFLSYAWRGRLHP